MKKFLSVFLVILILFCSIPFSSSAVTVELYGDIDNTSVEADLKKMKHSLADYPKDPTATYCRIVDFIEYSYEYDGTSEDYGIYIYLYNPSGKKIDTSSATIKMQGLGESNSLGDGSGLADLNLIYCDHSTSSGYEYVFYKFKVGHVTKTIHPKLSRDMRHYHIDSVTFAYSGTNQKQLFAIGGRYSFIGYMPYCNKSQTLNNTLQQFVSDKTAVDIELHPVTWKTQTTDNGYGYCQCMYSVYFAVPNDIINTYGDVNKKITKGLKEIRGSFEEYKVNGVITPDSVAYNTLYKYMNRPVTEEGNEDIPVVICPEYELHEKHNVKTHTCSHRYNCTRKNISDDDYISKYTSVFKYHGDGKEFSKLSVEVVTTALNSIWEDKGFMHMGIVEPGRKLGYQMYKVEAGEDLTAQIATYASVNTKFQAWLKGESNLYIEDEVYEKAESIQVITSADVANDVEEVSKNLFIEEDAVDSLKEFVTESNAENKTVYIMRFAVRDYYFVPARLTVDNKVYSQNDGNYYYEMTIFKDLDIFTFEFEDKYQKSTIIPVLAEPVDVIPSVDTTRDPQGDLNLDLGDLFNPDKDKSLWDTIKLIFVIIAGLTLFGVVIWFLDKLGFDFGKFFGALFKLLKKFFKWLWEILKKIWNAIIKFLKKIFK